MPTARALTFLSAALVLYLFANQTQVGWLYVMSALLAGVVLVAWWSGRSVLTGLSGRRQINQVELYEGETVQISLSLGKQKGSTFQLRVDEHCPLAAPDSPRAAIKLFVPALPDGGMVAFDYDVLVDRRGMYEFPPLAITSRAPFGFFKRQRALPIAMRALVYPEVRPLLHLDLLDKRATPEVTRQRAGVGYEVIGVRPFRTGDSARHIHWRSVARTNELMSKEFADETQPGLTLVLDVYGHPFPQTESKHTSFEWAVKIAASVGEYARRKGYPLHVLVDDQVLAIPVSPVSWSALLQYLGRIQPTGKRRLGQVMGNQPTQASTAVILPWLDPDALEPLLALRHRRLDVLAVVVDAESFPAGGISMQAFAAQLRGAGIPTRHVRFGDDWTTQLSDLSDVGGAYER